MFCKYCGKEIEDSFVACPYCGARQKDEANEFGSRGSDNSNRTSYSNYSASPNGADSGSFGWGLLGFLIPMVGLILFLVWKNDKPRSAKSAGIGALVSVIIAAFMCCIMNGAFLESGF